MPMVVTMLTCFVGDLGSRTEQSGVIQTIIDGQNAGKPGTASSAIMILCFISS
jgi:hypothetical protein